MNYVTIEVQIDHGKIVASQPEKLPANGRGLLTIFTRATPSERLTRRIELPLIHGDGERLINPTADQLAASLWES